MSASLLERIERDLDKIGAELWDVDVPDSTLDRILQKLSSLKAQVSVQKSLQATANLLRQQQVGKALPNHRARGVKYLIHFVFRKESRRGARHKQLRDWDCNALKLLGLSYSIKEIVKMEDAEFELLRTRGPGFFRRRELSRLLYRPDVDKAVNVMVNDADDDGSYVKFIQDHTTTRLQIHKRKFDAVDGAADNQAAMYDKAGPSQEKEAATKLYKGDVFIVSKDDTQYAVSNVDHVGEIWLTNPEGDYEAYDVKKRSFLTLWLSREMGEELARRSKPMVCT
ncbi:hypothetical protein QBC40DRAFT_271891 [Triangularia verruculosa]|uniref:Uncharacterized protein n=1 Tax=Triangularia verruculosa TaxID=2587418 RepID=A0AAN6XUK7_9PEZI|nr:hypothetical protein QBC40DRAFT_271891 [Triangularia verruculosa]